MPRSKAEATESSAPQAGVAPRRSTRISSQSTALGSSEGQVQPRSSSKSGKKRGVEGGVEASAKKARSETAEGAPVIAEGHETTELGQIDIGDSLPVLTLKNERDEDVEISTLAAERGVVLFLVPKADTPGCTTQACGFRDIYPDFTQLGFDVHCLSADQPTAQSKWQTKKNLPYRLISDPKRLLIRALGAGEGGKTKRSHFIFDKDGKLVDKKLPVKPGDSPTLAIDFLKGLSQA